VKRYFGNWEETQRAGMIDDFKTEEIPADAAILFAGYWYGDYDGSAIVLYQEGDKLFEVSGGHCSCNRLEGQWEHGGEVTAAALAMRPELDEDRADEDARAAWRELVRQLGAAPSASEKQVVDPRPSQEGSGKP
jgi:hypothetical protein